MDETYTYTDHTDSSPVQDVEMLDQRLDMLDHVSRPKIHLVGVWTHSNELGWGGLYSFGWSTALSFGWVWTHVHL